MTSPASDNLSEFQEIRSIDWGFLASWVNLCDKDIHYLLTAKCTVFSFMIPELAPF